MMMGGRRAYTGGIVPRVVQVGVSRYTRRLPARGDPLAFLVSMHVEGTATSWQRNVTLTPALEAQLLEWIDGMRRWSGGMGLTRATAREAVVSTGAALRDTFLGTEGTEVLAGLSPTAILWGIDETVIHLPWEMTTGANDTPLLRTPLGRIVASRILPQRSRDMDTEDPKVRILVVDVPSDGLAESDREVEAINGFASLGGGPEVEIVTLSRGEATRDAFRAAVRGQDFDIVHFAGHGRFDSRYPGDVSIVLADGPFDDEAVLGLEWSRPPFVVVNSSCESGRAAPGRRIVTAGKASNGLAAAFLARGVEAYLGHYFPVPDTSAAEFAQAFYGSLINTTNIGTAVQHARMRLMRAYESDAVDLTAFGATFFGDAGTAERYDVAMAA